ncbi:hypothetical protein M0804_003702 [Polistes exclamans]|nr:hypothetical protein M0804_003702 [Polistes exclamans]
MRISRAGQDDGDVDAPIMQTFIVERRCPACEGCLEDDQGEKGEERGGGHEENEGRLRWGLTRQRFSCAAVAVAVAASLVFVVSLARSLPPFRGGGGPNHLPLRQQQQQQQQQLQQQQQQQQQ